MPIKLDFVSIKIQHSKQRDVAEVDFISVFV